METNNIQTVASVAGFCMEEVLWKALSDISGVMLSIDGERIHFAMPSNIIIEGEKFSFKTNENVDTTPEFLPPESDSPIASRPGAVWSLGALICYMSSGHYIFGGRGGKYQQAHPQVDLPILRKEHSRLTPIVQQCLCFTPSQRISLKELHAKALAGFEACKNKKRVKIEETPEAPAENLSLCDVIWPEQLI